MNLFFFDEMDLIRFFNQKKLHSSIIKKILIEAEIYYMIKWEYVKNEICISWGNNLEKACKVGDINYIKKNISNNFEKDFSIFDRYWGRPLNRWDIQKGFEIACKNNYIEIVDFLYEKYKKYQTKIRRLFDFDSINFYDGLRCSCENGNLELVKLLHLKGLDIKNFLPLACYSQNLELIKFLIEKGADNFNGGFENACCKGNFNIINYLLIKGASNLNEGLKRASRAGHYILVKYLINLGANDFNEALFDACYEDNLDIVELLIKCGAKNIKQGFKVSVYSGQVTLIKYFINLGYDIKKLLMQILAQNNNLKESYIKNIKKIIDIPEILNELKLFKWMLKKYLFNLEKLFILAFNNNNEKYCICLIEEGVILENIDLKKIIAKDEKMNYIMDIIKSKK